MESGAAASVEAGVAGLLEYGASIEADVAGVLEYGEADVAGLLECGAKHRFGSQTYYANACPIEHPARFLIREPKRRCRAIPVHALECLTELRDALPRREDFFGGSEAAMSRWGT